MQKRNFNILIASICVGIAAFWLTAYNVVALGIDPIEYITRNVSQITGEEDDEEILITIRGNGVKDELDLSLKDMQSDNYIQVEDKEFKIVTKVEPHYYIYSGVSLWSILEEENILDDDPTKLTFLFKGSDGYPSPEPLSVELAQNNSKKVILAYEIDGHPIFNDGPIRSVIDHSVFEDEDTISSQYSVKFLRYVEIEKEN